MPSNGFFFILKGSVIPPPVISEFPLLTSEIPTGPVCPIN